MVYGWHYSRGQWHLLTQHEDSVACARELERLAPGPTNLHRRLTTGAHPDTKPPAPHGDGVRRDE